VGPGWLFRDRLFGRRSEKKRSGEKNCFPRGDGLAAIPPRTPELGHRIRTIPVPDARRGDIRRRPGSCQQNRGPRRPTPRSRRGGHCVPSDRFRATRTGTRGRENALPRLPTDCHGGNAERNSAKEQGPTCTRASPHLWADVREPGRSYTALQPTEEHQSFIPLCEFPGATPASPHISWSGTQWACHRKEVAKTNAGRSEARGAGLLGLPGGLQKTNGTMPVTFFFFLRRARAKASDMKGAPLRF